MNKEYKGFIITVWPIAYGWYKYMATSTTDHKTGKVEAVDDLAAYDKVKEIIDTL
jgi:hypothetical protein